MKDYISIRTKLHWKELVPKIEPNICSLQIKNDQNYLIAWGTQSIFSTIDKFNFNEFQQFITDHRQKYILGFLGYDIKNDIEPSLSSNNPDHLNFPNAYFFVPEHVIVCINGKKFYLGSYNKKELETLLDKPLKFEEESNDSIDLKPLITEKEYIQKIELIKQKIQRGDVYEMNYCMPFEADVIQLNDFKVFCDLYDISEAPFSSFMRIENGTIISASPERFFKKHSDKLISQPIKGTAKRSLNSDEDKRLLHDLTNDPKERSENIMIVDLVRNDLSKIAVKNSVKVTELCQPFTFKTVHQLISTVKCQIKAEVSISDTLRALFPMGSMTGAPKISAMEIAEDQEVFKRGVYSGAIGVFHPNGNCDFNVVIRSILYNSREKKISAAVGGAITIKSDPQKEYEECMVKLNALKQVLC